jgi:hypothetical protein
MKADCLDARTPGTCWPNEGLIALGTRPSLGSVGGADLRSSAPSPGELDAGLSLA